MNACFVMNDAALEPQFAAFAKEEGMIGIKGHRTTGGFRVSMYNALSRESVEALCDAMRHFAKKKG